VEVISPVMGDLFRGLPRRADSMAWPWRYQRTDRFGNGAGGYVNMDFILLRSSVSNAKFIARARMKLRAAWAILYDVAKLP